MPGLQQRRNGAPDFFDSPACTTRGVAVVTVDGYYCALQGPKKNEEFTRYHSPCCELCQCSTTDERSILVTPSVQYAMGRFRIGSEGSTNRVAQPITDETYKTFTVSQSASNVSCKFSVHTHFTHLSALYTWLPALCWINSPIPQQFFL